MNIYPYKLTELGSSIIPSLEESGRNATFVDVDATEAQVTSLEFVENFGRLVGFLLSFISVIFFLFIFYGGLMWLTAAGNEEKIAKARKLIIQSIVALFVLTSAYLLVNLVFQVYTRATDFSL